VSAGASLAALLAALPDLGDLDDDVLGAAQRAAQRADTGAAAASARNAAVRARVLAAFLAEGIAQSDLAGTLGYGYDDAARDAYERLLARVLGAERALARLSFVSGTHAIVAALAACAPPGARLLSATGRPYDTLRNALADDERSLASRGVRYDEVALGPDGLPNLDALDAAARAGVDVVFVQRSRGYATRRSLSASACGEIARVVRARAPEALVLVDNCYGELVEASEPTHHGVDLVMGSLIKNLGGSLAPGGGYVAGRADLVERVAAYHYAPGLGAAVGSSLGFGRAFVQGLFFAPTVVGESLAGLDFVAALFDELGFRVDPQPGEERRDIVQAIRLGDVASLVAFARGLQRAMPLDARFAPEPGSVPGYREPVVMSSGAFVSGATIELSCDAPLRAPYEVYLQGGTVREHAMLGGLYAAHTVRKESIRGSSEKAGTMGNVRA
jgi:cystathionine beta-lyase family protein involved in aluminum resistance